MADEQKAASLNREIVTTIYEKADNVSTEGAFSKTTPIGVNFSNVFSKEDPETRQRYTLQNLADNYLNFVKNTLFVYKGDTQPVNSHTAIWIDTSSNPFPNSEITQ